MSLTPLQQKLAGGDRRSVGCAYDVAQEVLDQPALLEEIIDGLRVDDAIVRSRTAHVLARVAMTRPTLVDPYKDEILQVFARVPQWEVREQMSKVIPRLKLTNDEIALAYQLWEIYLQDRSSIVRTCAMQAMCDLLPYAPERRDGVVTRLHELTKTGTAAMRALGRKLLASLDGE